VKLTEITSGVQRKKDQQTDPPCFQLPSCILNAFRSPVRYNGWFREQLGQRFTFFQFLSNDDGRWLKFSVRRDGKWEQGEPVCWYFFLCTPGHFCSHTECLKPKCPSLILPPRSRRATWQLIYTIVKMYKDKEVNKNFRNIFPCVHFMSTSSINQNHERCCLSGERSNRSSRSPIKMLA
jgi:hypothetical protein